MRLPAILALLLLPLAALAADEPEQVYAKFHRAVMAGELDEMLKHGPTQRRAEIQGMSASSKEAALKMAQFMMPRAFTLERKTPTTPGRVTLIVSGPGDAGSGKLETIYGTVRMLQESGNWKVDEATWSSERPSILSSAPVTASPRPASDKAPARTAAPAVEAPTRKLRDAKPECVYKPVMTAKDMEACK